MFYGERKVHTAVWTVERHEVSEEVGMNIE